MSQTPHSLPKEFPEYAAKLHDLQQSDHHLAKLSGDYDEINEAIHLAETDLKPTSDDHMAEMRKQRLALKDKIAAHLHKT